MAEITHNTRVATGGIGANVHSVQAYAIQVGRGETEIRLDLNVEEGVTMLDLTPDHTRRIISVLRASLTDADEMERGSL